eukprot:5653658-Amphidinium_carterae.2
MIADCIVSAKPHFLAHCAQQWDLHAQGRLLVFASSGTRSIESSPFESASCDGAPEGWSAIHGEDIQKTG